VNFIEHFLSQLMQGGMNCLCCTPDADRVIKMNYEGVLAGDLNCVCRGFSASFFAWSGEFRIMKCQRKMQRLQYLQIEAVSSAVTFMNNVNYHSQKVSRSKSVC